jgi:oligopeptide/dipeptide ABC transporter ATP-binding protein
MKAEQNAMLRVEGLSKRFSLENRFFNLFGADKSSYVQALCQVSFAMKTGETLGILGESGSGKSTLARVLLGIYAADSGSAFLHDESIFSAYQNKAARLQILRKMQMIFQDPFSSLDPRMTVRQIIAEPLKIHGLFKRQQSEQLLEKTLIEVGLTADCLDRYPTEFSGGQRQRIGICRAMILNPSLLVADEAVSALDVSVQAQILELLCRLRQDRQLSMIFISHDVAVVRQISDRILLMFRGHVVEEMPADCLLRDAKHPYTLELLASASYLREGTAITESGTAVSLAQPAVEGCCYRFVCSQACDKCAEQPPEKFLHDGHRVFCWKADC